MLESGITLRNPEPDDFMLHFYDEFIPDGIEKQKREIIQALIIRYICQQQAITLRNETAKTRKSKKTFPELVDHFPGEYHTDSRVAGYVEPGFDQRPKAFGICARTDRIYTGIKRWPQGS